MNIAFSGTRRYDLSATIRLRIRYLIDSTTINDVIFVGDCETGVDQVVRLVARGSRQLVVAHAAWLGMGLGAGPARNRLLGVLSDQLYAFPERDEVLTGSGTWDTVRAFEGLGRPVEVFGGWKRFPR